MELGAIMSMSAISLNLYSTPIPVKANFIQDGTTQLQVVLYYSSIIDLCYDGAL